MSHPWKSMLVQWAVIAAIGCVGYAAAHFPVAGAVNNINLLASQANKPKLLLDWNSVYVTENGLLSIKPWANGFPKQIYLGKELDAKVEVWVESPDGGKQQVFITLGDLRSLIYTRARARVYEGGPAHVE